MSKRNDGGSAFPRVGEGVGDPRYDDPGMTLRDYFAAKAMEALINSPHRKAVDIGELTGIIANESYKMADAMLEKREE